MIHKAKILVLFLFFAVSAFISAQTAAELEEILDTPAITYLQAARFVAASVPETNVPDLTIVSADTDELPDASEPDDADEPEDDPFQYAKSMGWLPKKAGPDDQITLKGFSYLLMRAFKMKGGLMYLIIPSPRYAYRSMVSRSFITGSSDPSMKVSGEQFLLILGNVLGAVGGEE